MEHYLASKITGWCIKRNAIAAEQGEVVTYGIELFLNTVLKVIALLFIGLITGLFGEVVISLGCFALLRTKAGGIHMKTSLGCFLSMFGICAAAILGSRFITSLPFWILVGCSMFVMAVIALFAPYFTQNNPITDKKLIKKKKGMALIIAAALLAAVWLLPDLRIKLLILIPVLIETISIFPCWHFNEKRMGY